MRLPNPDRAVVEMVKLSEYCLNERHEHGKHKARVFRSALGITAADADWLRDRLIEAAMGDASRAATSRFGEIYVIDFEVRTRSGVAPVRSSWIVRTGEDFPRLITCYVKRVS